MTTEAVVVFAKEPIPGRVKTRLAKSIGDEAACRVYRSLLAYTLAAVSRSGRRAMLWLTPESDSNFLKDPIFSGYLEIYRQCDGGLGDRMHFMFRSLVAAGIGRSVLIGSDCPGLTPAHIDASFEMLKDRDCVLGPTEDGGYWLVGMNTPGFDLFSEIEFSQSEVFSNTLDRIEALKLTFGQIAMLSDIDTINDLDSFCETYAGADPHLLELQLLSTTPGA